MMMHSFEKFMLQYVVFINKMKRMLLKMIILL